MKVRYLSGIKLRKYIAGLSANKGQRENDEARVLGRPFIKCYSALMRIGCVIPPAKEEESVAQLVSSSFVLLSWIARHVVLSTQISPGDQGFLRSRLSRCANTESKFRLYIHQQLNFVSSREKRDCICTAPYLCRTVGD